MAKFAGYGFNKSHSAAYSLLAYHTAWLKTHYPVEFMAALLTSETSKPENVVKYISRVPRDGHRRWCRRMCRCRLRTLRRCDGSEAIRFGLAAIKNVGHNAIESIIEARAALQAEGKPGFASLWEFCEKVDLRLMNKRVLESLIKAGAMDCFGKRAAGDGGARQGDGAGAEGAEGCGGGAAWAVRDLRRTCCRRRQAKEEALPNAPEWDEHTRLQNEKDVLGFFVSRASDG